MFSLSSINKKVQLFGENLLGLALEIISITSCSSGVIDVEEAKVACLMSFDLGRSS